MAIYGIDCGHGLDGYPNSGATGLISESVETRNLGNKVINYIKQLGHTVINCTVDKPTSNKNSLEQRVAKANTQKLDLFVSIHFNSGGGKGTEVFTANGDSLIQAANFLKEITNLGFTNRGIKNGSHLYVINNTVAKSMLIEICFVDSETDVNLYKASIDNIAKIIAESITGEKINNLGDDDMISDTVKVFACPDSSIVTNMKDEITLLQGVVNITKDGVATEKLVKLLPELTGVESRGCVTVMQRILILKGMLSKGSDTGIIGDACKNGINRFKDSVGIPTNTKLIDRQTWRKLLEY